MNKYLLVFDPVDQGIDAMLDFVDGLPDVTDWHASLNSAVVLVTSADTKSLTERVRDRFPEIRFVVTAIDPVTSNGILPRATWDFLQRDRAAVVG